MITANVIRPPLKTSRASPRCFELEKCQVKAHLCVWLNHWHRVTPLLAVTVLMLGRIIWSRLKAVVSSTHWPICQLHFTEFNWHWLSFLFYFLFLSLVRRARYIQEDTRRTYWIYWLISYSLGSIHYKSRFLLFLWIGENILHQLFQMSLIHPCFF